MRFVQKVIPYSLKQNLRNDLIYLLIFNITPIGEAKEVDIKNSKGSRLDIEKRFS